MAVIPVVVAATDSLGVRLGVCAVSCFLGTMLVMVGRENVRTRTAGESGGRRLVNTALGRSNNYKGTYAVVQGWMRILSGILAIVFGIVFLFVGPFLAK